MKAQYKQNVFCLFGTSLTIFFSQGLFFVCISGYFSTLKDPLIALGNVFLLAMIPYIFSVLLLAPNIDKISTNLQLTLITSFRSLILILLGIGVLLKKNASDLIYIAILFYDLCFFLYQNVSAKMSKTISIDSCTRKTESFNLLGTQIGMALGGLTAGYLVSIYNIGIIFILAGTIEAIGILISNAYKDFSFSNKRSEKPKLINFFELKKIFCYLLDFNVLPFSLLPFILILPLQQVFNLITGPWAYMKFSDYGNIIGWLVFGVAIGACAGSFILIYFSNFRNSKIISLSPAMISLSVLGLYVSYNLIGVLGFSVLFGLSFTLTRVVIRSNFIDSIQIDYINPVTMLAITISALLSSLIIFLISYVYNPSIFQIFVLIAFISSLQLAILIIKSKVKLI